MAEKKQYKPLRGINIGMGLAIGLAIGVALYIATDNYMMLIGGIGIGLGFAGILQRQQQKKQDRKQNPKRP